MKRIIENFGFTSYFDVICGSDPNDELNQNATMSQKARIIAKTLSLLCEKGHDAARLAKETVMIGDTGYDVDGAHDNHLPASPSPSATAAAKSSLPTAQTRSQIP